MIFFFGYGYLDHFSLGNTIYSFNLLYNIIAKYKTNKSVILFSNIVHIPQEQCKIIIEKNLGNNISHFLVGISGTNQNKSFLLNTILEHKLFRNSQSFYELCKKLTKNMNDKQWEDCFHTCSNLQHAVSCDVIIPPLV